MTTHQRGYVFPGNRSNQHTPHWYRQLYPIPVQDKTNILSIGTKKANAVLKTVAFKYRKGMRVYAVTAQRQPITGVIVDCDENMGQEHLYTVTGDDNKTYVIAQYGIKSVLSIEVYTGSTAIVLIQQDYELPEVA